MERENEFLYLQLAQNIREQILTGFLKPGKFLLSENQLCQQYKISRSSVRKALDLLVQEGLIVKRVGQGTFVAPELPGREDRSRSLTIVATSPSYYIDYCMPQIIAAFRKEFPHVSVKLLSIPGAAFRESLEASIGVGFQPDLLFVSDQQWKEFVQYPSSEFHDLKSLSGSLPHPIYPDLSRSFAVGGQTLALPVSFSSVYLVYNPRLFAEFGVQPPGPGWKIGDFLACAEALTRDTDGDGIADICGFSLPISLSRWPAVALSLGVRFQHDHDSTAMARTLTLFHDMLFRRRVAALAVRSRLNSEAFARGKTGMVLTTAFEAAEWRKRGLDFEPQIAPLPFALSSAPLLIANALMAPKAGAQADLAKHFIRVALGKEVQAEILRDNRFLSVLPEVNDSAWGSEQLRSMALDEGSLSEGYFFHDLLGDSVKVAELEREMELFWAGLESAVSFAGRYLEIMRG